MAQRSYALYPKALCWVACIFLLAACPAPFDGETLSVLQDRQTPVISIQTPIDGGSYESTILVQGNVFDKDESGSARAPGPGVIRSLSYQLFNVPGSPTPIPLDETGQFAFSIPTEDKSGPITILIEASDRNGNTAQAAITLNPDTLGPSILIDNPVSYAEYAVLLPVQGSIYNSPTDMRSTEVYPTVTVSLPGTSVEVLLPLDENGHFAGALDLSGISGTRSLLFQARDLNGNESRESITIQKPADGGDISNGSRQLGDRSTRWYEYARSPHAE